MIKSLGVFLDLFNVIEIEVFIYWLEIVIICLNIYIFYASSDSIYSCNISYVCIASF